MEDNEQQPAAITEASTPQAVERPLWVLSRDDQRVLFITFVGGLASIIVSACVIGGAIAVARAEKASHYPLFDQTFGTVAWVVGTAVIVIANRGLIPGSRERFGRFWLLVWYGLSSIYLLSWIGMAAGIH